MKPTQLYIRSTCLGLIQLVEMSELLTQRPTWDMCYVGAWCACPTPKVVCNMAKFTVIVFILCCSYFTFYFRFLEDLDEGIYIQQTIESVLTNEDGKQLMVRLD